jgi:iron-sulfur cluster repair protein YtfE (RIC family)
MNNYQSLTSLTTGATIGQIIQSNPNAVDLLTSIGLSPDKHEHETLRSVCKQRQWGEVEILGWLKRQCFAKDEKNRTANFGPDLSGLSKYMTETFIIPNYTLLKDIKNDWPRVHQIHGNQYTGLKDVNWYFKVLSRALETYYKFEEKEFYPLVETLNDQKEILDDAAQNIKRSLQIIHENQRRLLGLMAIIREKGNDFKNPEGACSTLRILNQNFKMFFESLKGQFKIEQEKIIPALDQKMNSVPNNG